MIKERSLEKGSNRRVHVFNTFFYSKLSKAGYSGVRRWTKKVQLAPSLAVNWTCTRMFCCYTESGGYFSLSLSLSRLTSLNLTWFLFLCTWVCTGVWLQSTLIQSVWAITTLFMATTLPAFRDSGIYPHPLPPTACTCTVCLSLSLSLDVYIGSTAKFNIEHVKV